MNTLPLELKLNQEKILKKWCVFMRILALRHKRRQSKTQITASAQRVQKAFEIQGPPFLQSPSKTSAWPSTVCEFPRTNFVNILIRDILKIITYLRLL